MEIEDNVADDAVENALSSAEALGQAWDAAESDDGEIPTQTDEESGTVAAGEEGGSDSVDGEEVHEGGVRSGDEQTERAGASGKEGQEPSLDTPPKGLSIEAREAWKDTPESVRAEIAKREQDYEAGIVKYAQNAKRAEAMDRSLAPYQSLFAVNGGPKQTIETLLQAGAALQMGAPGQKAQVVANMIKQFGVDIKTLDGLLVGEVDPEVQAQSQLDQLLNQRLAPIQQQLQQYQQREQQQLAQSQQQVQSEVSQFGQQHEFYDDVKMEMADLLDMAANRGRPMTMEQAYNIACSSNPQISKIMSARQSQQSSQARRAAASSVRGAPGAQGGGSSTGSRLAALNDAWDNAGRM